MRTIRGKILGLLTDSTGEISGIILDSGQVVSFSGEEANDLLSVVAIGSEVEIEVSAHDNAGKEAHLDARVITDLDSKRSVTFRVSHPSHPPEVDADLCPPPGTATPLVPASWAMAKQITARICARLSEEAATQIARGYDVLSRVQATLVSIKGVQCQGPAIGKYLDEAKHMYAQAIGCYEIQDFQAAREFAAASCDLSRVVEILISGTFQSSLQSALSDFDMMPPAHILASGDAAEITTELDRTERQLSRIQWVTENGTLPSEDRARVLKLSLWGASLQRRARQLLETGTIEEAIEYAKAANAAAGSAEHFCKQCYIAHAVH